MNVLVDRHHAGLFHSLQLLFEDRLGMTVYTPIGHEWWDENYWAFGQGYGDDRLAQQFLMVTPETNFRQYEGEMFTSNVLEQFGVIHDGHYPDRLIRGITLAEFRTMDWGYIVCSVQDNQHGFSRLAQEVGAKYVYQIGNVNAQVDWRLEPIALISAEHAPQGTSIVMHQEFDTDLFAFTPPGTDIVSMVNCFGSTYCATWWNEAKALLPEFTFREHGIDGADGNIGPIAEQADAMRAAGWGWHDKVQGDGFGHVIHQWAALGRPLIGHGSHYHGLMAAPFWEDGVTCLDLDRRSIADTVALIREISGTERHAEMGRAIRAVFDGLVDFAAEAEAIRAIL